MLGILVHIFLFVLTIQITIADFCSEVQKSGDMTCHTCVEVTLLGTPNCAYCANPYPKQAYCSTPFTPPAVDIPNLTPYACYNDTGIPGPFRYLPRCAQNNCYVNQCLVSGVVLWYIIVPVVVGGVIVVGSIIIWCYCRRRAKRQAEQWKIQDEKNQKIEVVERQVRSDGRKKERQTTTNKLRQKYGLLDSDDMSDDQL